MSSARRPGGPSEAEAVLVREFGVPRHPAIGRDAAVQRVRERIVADNLRCERLDISDEVVPRDALFDMSGKRVEWPDGPAYDRCYVALIDPDAQLLWGHRAYWAFVPAGPEGEVVVRETDFPERAEGRVRLDRVPLP